jgi:uncharacterized protein
VTSPTPNSATVSNTSCLIALEAIGKIDLLEKLYQKVLIPPAVASEWGTACPQWIVTQQVQSQALVQALRLQLGAGEAEAIALSVEINAARVILDDQRARRVGVQLHQTVTGTIGIILRAKQLGIVPLVRPIFDDLRAAGLWISQNLLRQALQIAGE